MPGDCRLTAGGARRTANRPRGGSAGLGWRGGGRLGRPSGEGLRLCSRSALAQRGPPRHPFSFLTDPGKRLSHSESLVLCV